MTTKSNRASIREILRDEICRGALTAGTPLRQHELAERFNVSRVPIREALFQLERERLVSYEPNRGAVVAGLTTKEIEDQVEILIALEGRAAKLALARMAEPDFQRMEAIVDAFETAQVEAEWAELDLRFHAVIYAATGNPAMVRLISDVAQNLSRFFHSALRSPATRGRSVEDHRVIITACREGDERRLLDRLERHVMEAWKNLLAIDRAEAADGARGLARRTDAW